MTAVPAKRLLRRHPPHQSAKIISIRRKLSELQGNRKNPAKSWSQLKQRELSWVLYITEGYIANLEHALTINAVSFNDKERKMIERIIRNNKTETDIIRKLMQQL